MSEVKILDEGPRLYRAPDPDGFREWVRDNKSRALADKLMTEQEAISRFTQDGDYLTYDCTMFQRGPSSLIRELVRQKRQHLAVAGRFTYIICNLLVSAGLVDHIDVGYFGLGNSLMQPIQDGKVTISEWTNGAMTARQLAGAMGVPFLPVRFLGGTDVFKNSGAKLIEDPFTGQPIALVPALNADVALIHAHQADRFGNARIFGTAITPLEIAMGSKRVILSAEEIIDTEEIRRNPGATTIPYYFVDAVVHAPFGTHPGTVQGRYASDTAHLIEFLVASNSGKMAEYIEKYIYSVGSHEEYLEQRVGVKRLLQLQRNEVIHEGYYL